MLIFLEQMHVQQVGLQKQFPISLGIASNVDFKFSG